MTDREKVIEWLDFCIRNTDSSICECEMSGCPYLGGSDVGNCFVTLMNDALALLKAQEPRVLALDEIHRGMAVWLEDVDKADVILAIGGSSAGKAKCFITANDMAIAPKDAEYGIRWRAWTATPTDEQRRAVKGE